MIRMFDESKSPMICYNNELIKMYEGRSKAFCFCLGKLMKINFSG